VHVALAAAVGGRRFRDGRDEAEEQRQDHGIERGRARRRGTLAHALGPSCLPRSGLRLALGGCRDQPDPVLGLVESLRAAAEDRDAQAIADRLSDDFKGNGSVDKAEAAATLRRYFAAYESVRLAVYDVSVTRRTDTQADVGFRAEFNGAARRIGGLDGFLPRRRSSASTAPGPPRSDWKVVAADWRPIEPLASPSP
jgi:hypothetical protein